MRLIPPLALLAGAISLAAVGASIPRACSSPEHQQFVFCNASLSTSERVEDLLRRLPLGEKVTLLTARASPTGNMSSIGLPEYNWGANCVHGVQSTCGTNCATSFPNPVNLGAIFDPQAVFDMAQVVGWELRALWLEGARENYASGPHLGLDCWSPNININRDPRWGRNMETPSEDPLVNSKYGVAYTKGLQEGKDKSDSGAIAGIYHQRHYTKTLCEAGRLAILSGTDVNSGSVYKQCLEELVTSGQLPEKAVDDAMRRTLKLRFELGLFDPIDDQPYWHVAPSEVNTAESRLLSLDLTRKSIVLLQNHGNILPLAKGEKLAVIGPHAKAKRALLGNYLGQMCHGDYLEVGCVQTPLEAITVANGASNTVYAKGSGINDTSTAGFDEAEAAARKADTVVLFLGIDTSIEREAWDRENIDMPNIQMQLLKRVRRAGKPTVVVLFNGGVVGAEELILHTDGVVEAFYPGFFGAQAVSDILFRDAIPSGKLPVTMYPSNYINSVDMKSMSMTKYPGRSYRYYKEVPVFPFGWGLSYTKFTLALDSESGVTDPSEPIVVTRDVDQTVTVILSNDGDLVGDEVVFAFFRPLKVNATGNAALLNEQLFDYRRVSLHPTQYRKLNFRIQQSTLAMVDDSGNQVSFPGFYEIIITNGVHERVTFAIHLVGEYETLSVFPTDTGYVSPPAQSENVPSTDIHLGATRAFEHVPVRPTEDKQPEAVAVAMAFD
ncbi:hypothetical protein PI125_g22084 [Phytophthora idaei]|nr:hypothetical protein PI125_g22084 [Phytophthora idaei]